MLKLTYAFFFPIFFTKLLVVVATPETRLKKFRATLSLFKIAFAFMLQTTSAHLVMLGSGGIALLMVAALVTHIRVNTPYFKRIPSALLLMISLLLFLIEYSVL